MAIITDFSSKILNKIGSSNSQGKKHNRKKSSSRRGLMMEDKIKNEESIIMDESYVKE
jgi:hypothetical protein